MITINLANLLADLYVAMLAPFLNIDYGAIPARLYTASFILTVIAYLVLIVFPRQSWANFWFSGVVVPVLLGLLYTFVLFIYAFQTYPNNVPPLDVSNPFDFLSVNGLRRLFLKDGLLLAGFLDLLIMPLLVAAWMTRKAAQIRMPYIFLLPCLVLTFGVPGTGVVVFFLLASTRGRLSEMARFEGQPPTNTAPVFARPSAPVRE
jgi:ABA4-like protein